MRKPFLGRLGAIGLATVIASAGLGIVSASLASERATITFDKALLKAERASSKASVFVLQAHAPKSLPDTFYSDRKRMVLEAVMRSRKWGTIEWQFGNTAYIRVTGNAYPRRYQSCYLAKKRSWSKATKGYSLIGLLHEFGVLAPSKGQDTVAGRTLVEKDYVQSTTVPGTKPHPPTLWSVRKITARKDWRITRGRVWEMGVGVTTVRVSYPKTLPSSVKRPTGPICKSPT